MHVVIDNEMRRAAMPVSAKSLVVDANIQRRNLVKELLNNMGYSTAESCGDISELNNNIKSADLNNVFLVIYAESVSDESLQQLKDFVERHPMPVLLLIDEIEKDMMTTAMRSGVTAFISLGVQGNRIMQAINSAFANFDIVSDLHAQINTLEDRLTNRIIIDKAKGLIMKNRDLDEAQSYEYLRNYAMKNGKKIVEVAEMTIATAELLNKET